MKQASIEEYDIFLKDSSLGIGDDHKHIMYSDENKGDKCLFLVDCPTVYRNGVFYNTILFKVHIFIMKNDGTNLEGTFDDVAVDFKSEDERPKHTGILRTYEETDDILDELYLRAAEKIKLHFIKHKHNYSQIEELELI